ncbi:hypothetical protein C7458_11421 [Williamsia muralis]|nr:hypothetical protein C7458_11421 [Williamsia marianensis]
MAPAKRPSPLDPRNPAVYLPVIIGGVPFVAGFCLLATGSVILGGVMLIAASLMILAGGFYWAHRRFAVVADAWCIVCSRRPRSAFELCEVCAADTR